jgi:hypothetical protein
MFGDYCVYAGSYFLSVLSAVNPAIAALKRPKALPREIGLQPIQLSISKKGQYASPAWGECQYYSSGCQRHRKRGSRHDVIG